MVQTVLNGAKHGRFAVKWVKAESGAELTVELHGADGRKAEVGDFVEVAVDGFGETAEGVSLAEAGRRGKDADTSDIIEIGKARGHLFVVSRGKSVFFGDGLFVERIFG